MEEEEEEEEEQGGEEEDFEDDDEEGEGEEEGFQVSWGQNRNLTLKQPPEFQGLLGGCVGGGGRSKALFYCI